MRLSVEPGEGVVRAGLRFRGLCRRLGADVGFVPYWGSPWMRPCPVVVTVHDLIPLLLPLYRGGALQRVYTPAGERHCAAGDGGHHGFRGEPPGYRGASCGCRPSGCTRSIWPRTAAAKTSCGAVDASFREPSWICPTGPFLLYLGGFDARKNVLRTLQGYAKLVRPLRR